MNPSSRLLLEKLLDTWQRNPERMDKVRLPITRTRAAAYFEVKFPEAKESLHASLEEAAATGVVTLEWGKDYESHVLKRITLIDGPGLADYLGVLLAAKQAEDAREVLLSEITGEAPWVEEWVHNLLDRWSRNQNADGLSPGSLQEARLLVKALEAVAAGRQLDLDLRTFSSKELGYSKAMEGILTRFATVWKKYHPTDLSTDELLDTLGLVKFPQPLLLRGPVTLMLEGRNLDCNGICPFVGLPPKAIIGLIPDCIPDYVLTVENLASFNRYTAEVRDNGLILFTAGFPSPGVADFIRMLDRAMPTDVPFLHWGDMDEGGLKIFAFIQELLRRNLQPHLMTAELLECHGQHKPDLRVKEVQLLAEKNSELAGLVEAILSGNPPRTLEQENVDPAPPCFLR
jgi:hypothetical protein